MILMITSLGDIAMDEAGLQLIDRTDYAKLEYDGGKLYSLIYEIIKLHEKFSNENLDINPFNLKKKLVRDIVEPVDDSYTYIINKDFHSVLNRYLSKIDQLTVDIDLVYTYSDLDFRLRVKQPESIIYKLGHYNAGKSENGKIPLNKCLNDLLGFRVILPNFSHSCEFFKEMCRLIEKSYKIKYINSSKGEYKATHLYFFGSSNKIFPWELQVWLPEDFTKNDESHAKHKQEYKNSAIIHKDMNWMFKEV